MTASGNIAAAAMPAGIHLLDGLQGAANAATVIGVLIAVSAAAVAVASLRTQAKSQELTAILTTNDLWLEVGRAPDRFVSLSSLTVSVVRRIYGELSAGDDASALMTHADSQGISLPVPFIVGSLLPQGGRERDRAPERENAYLNEMRARALALGYVRTVLGDRNRALQWLSDSDMERVLQDFATLDAAMNTWVNRMNEVAELYEGNLVDRRRFVGKRSVAIVQQLFVAEPYILWRNSTISGRWGLRVLGLGAEARLYHWRSVLQKAAIQLREDADPHGYSPSSSYRGFSACLGWIIGPGSTPRGGFARWIAEARIRRGLGAGYGARSKARQNDLVETLPRSTGSGLASGTLTWAGLIEEPTAVKDAIAMLRRP
jgi:hypothetical protein